MNKSNFTAQLNSSWSIVNGLELGQVYSTPCSLDINEEFRDIALCPKQNYATLYQAGLRLSHYNFILNDYSYFQFSLQGENQVRYAYYPNPYISGDETKLSELNQLQQYLEEGIISQEEYLSSLSEGDVVNAVPLIRYENAPEQHRPFLHPCSHFHIGYHSENRWPLNRLLTPKAFTLTVIKQYYGNYWTKCDNSEAPTKHELEQELITEKSNCRIISESFFTESESLSFYFT